jgi:hypothetical protein
VARKVAAMAICEFGPVRQTAPISPTRSEPTAAKMSSAARVGMATAPTIPEKTARMRTIHSPEKIEAHRVRAPAAWLRAVWPTEPPTGWPRKRPAPMLPKPCATKSTLASERDPSSLGADSATPTPWTSTIAATARAPARSDIENAESSGHAGIGTPRGMSPWSLTCAMSAPVMLMTTVGTASATTALNVASRVRPSRRMMARAPAPARTDAGSIRLGWVRTSHAFCRATDPSPSAPVRSGICPAMMFTATPLRKPIITEWLTKRARRPRRSRPAATIAAPAIRVRRNSAAGRSSGLRLSTAEPAARAEALVVVITMSLVLALSPPATGPAKLA